MCLYPTLSRIIGLKIKLQNLQLTHALREIFSFLCGCLPWGRLFFLSASRFNFGFCRSLSTHFFIWFFSFFFLLDSITCRHFLSIHRCSESLRRWLDVFWFGFFRFSSSSDVIQIFLNRLSVSTVDFSDHFTACEYFLRISLSPVSVEAFSDLRNLVMLHDVEVALVSSVDHGSYLLKSI